MRTFEELTSEEQSEAVLTIKLALWDQVHALVEKDTELWRRRDWVELGADYLPRWGWRKMRWRLHRDLTKALDTSLGFKETATWMAYEASFADESEVAIQLGYPLTWEERVLAKLPHYQVLDYSGLGPSSLS